MGYSAVVNEGASVMKVGFLLFLLVPVWIWNVSQRKKIYKSLGFLYGERPQTAKILKRFKLASHIKLWCWSIAWILLVVALAKPSWGTEPVPVQRNGNAVSFVFDISWSMMAKDVSSELGETRLQAASNYANLLLSHLDGSDVSVVIAKGEGIVAIPCTSDYSAISNFVASLSPEMMSAEGTNLEAGIKAAVQSFPPQMAKFSTIVLFTDAEETKASLEQAAYDALRYGINLVFVGFGNTTEIDVLAGDKTTKVKTALREKNINEIIAKVNKKMPLSASSVKFVKAAKKGSARQVISCITGSEDGGTFMERTGYEMQEVERHSSFVFAALIFFCLGCFFAEFRIPSGKKNNKKSLAILLLPFLLFFTSCSENANGSFEILEGTVAFHRHDYQKAVACFFNAKEISNDNLKTKSYAQFGLATTYLMLGETETALENLQKISDNAPSEILFGSFYNSGLAAYSSGHYDKAIELFRNALLLQSNNIEAKINLELSLQKKTSTLAADKEINAISKTDETEIVEEAIFSIIKEDERNRWKNQFVQEEKSTALDY